MNDISLGKFLRLTLIGHALFSLPVVITLVLLELLSISGLVILSVFFSVIGIPLSAGISYLVARGSSISLEMNERRYSALMITSGILPGQIYGAFFGGVLGYHFDDRVGGVIGAILFFIIGRWVGERVGRYLSNNRL